MSKDGLRISSCSLVKAFFLSPYSNGLLVSKSPSKQYAMSSCRVGFLEAAHLMLQEAAGVASCR